MEAEPIFFWASSTITVSTVMYNVCVYDVHIMCIIIKYIHSAMVWHCIMPYCNNIIIMSYTGLDDIYLVIMKFQTVLGMQGHVYAHMHTFDVILCQPGLYAYMHISTCILRSTYKWLCGLSIWSRSSYLFSGCLLWRAFSIKAPRAHSV